MCNPSVLRAIVASFILAWSSSLQSGPMSLPPENPWDYGLSLTVKESYDTNVFLLDLEPDPASAAAARAAGFEPAPAKHASLVTSIMPRLELSSKSEAGLKVAASYSPEIVRYHQAEVENYTAHRGTLNFTGSRADTAWEVTNAATYVDGGELGSVFARPGDVPAIGAVPIHERMEQFFIRNGFKATLPTDHGFVRPVATFYYHDFRGAQLRAGPGFAYENHIDRSEFTGGFDLGFQAWENTAFVLGYRYGGQSQYKLFTTDSPYDNRFHRILFGIEGDPCDWLKVAILAGPDLRDFHGGTPPGFDPDELLYFIDGKVTLMPGKADSIILTLRRLEQPATSSQSLYEDIVYDATWKHKFGEHWGAGAGFRIYGGDWQAPVAREDWIFTPSVSVSYLRDASFSAELGYSYDWVDNRVPVVPGTATAFADGREFTRSILSLSGKYCF